MSENKRLAEIKKLREEMANFKKLIEDFFKRHREGVDSRSLTMEDIVKMNTEWKTLLEIKKLIDHKANQLGVGVGNN